jgi:hypothetical protein
MQATTYFTLLLIICLAGQAFGAVRPGQTHMVLGAKDSPSIHCRVCKRKVIARSEKIAYGKPSHSGGLRL